MRRRYPKALKEIRNIYGKSYGDDVYHDLERGRAVLRTEQELNQYLYSYGNMHANKLYYVYNELFKNLSVNFGTKIQIIDYGCGQGLASIGLLNRLALDHFDINNVLEIILIEPSAIALKRAEELLKNTFSIKLVNKYLNDINDKDIKRQGVTLHLFSNILDMGGTHFDIKQLANKIIKSKTNSEFFACVGALGENKLIEFSASFQNQIGFERISRSNGAVSFGTWKIVYDLFCIR